MGLLIITGDRHPGSVVISSSCPSAGARSLLRFYNFMNLSAPEQVAVQIIQIYLLFFRSLGGFQYFRIERIISGDWSRKYDKCYCHKMIMIQIFRYYLYLYLYLLPLLFATLQVEGWRVHVMCVVGITHSATHWSLAML